MSDAHALSANTDIGPDPSKITASDAEQRLFEESLSLRGLEVSTDPEGDDDGTAAAIASGPEIVAAAAIPPIQWPADDADAPDYAHVSDISAEEEFELTPADLETLITLNAFDPMGKDDTLTIAIRGAALKTGNELEQVATATIKNVRPDHENFRCLLGFYFRGDKTLTLFTGSTVPCPKYMENYYRRKNNIPPFSTSIACNMLPNGCYVFRVATHAGGTIKPALRMTDPTNFSSDGAATVLRTKNDLTFSTEDDWDEPDTYFDNVHCSYVTTLSPTFRAHFSSAGCLTVRGEKTPSHQWKKFQGVLNDLGQGARTDLILLTGKELAIASRIRTEFAGDASQLGDPRRLRIGSSGEAVSRLQQRMGFSGTDYFGPTTRKRLTEIQSEKGVPVDGIFTPKLDQDWAWTVFDPPVA